MIVRAATPADYAQIRAVVAAAFNNSRSDEAGIVEGVRAASEALVELVADLDGEVTGHVLFSRITCTPVSFVAGLGPLAVAPDHQGSGIGSALARSGLEACRAMGVRGCVVLGAPAYYGRFGFTSAPPAIRSRFAGLKAFQAIAFDPGLFAAPIDIAYPAAFD